MAERTSTIITKHDDIDDMPNAETYRLSLDGRSVEIDLAEDNGERLRALLEPYFQAGREISGGSTPVATTRKFSRPSEPVKPPTSKNGNGNGKAKTKSNGKTKVATPDAGAVRAWAKEKGIDVNPRGRVQKAIVQQYLAERPVDFTQPAEAPAAPRKARGKKIDSTQPAADAPRKVRGGNTALTSREILDLHNQKGTNKALAEAMGCSINTAVKRLRVAQEELAAVTVSI